MDELFLAAESAARLLKADVFVHSIRNANHAIIRAWADADSVEAREEAHSDLRALRRVVKELDRLVAGHPDAARMAALQGEVEKARQAPSEENGSAQGEGG